MAKRTETTGYRLTIDVDRPLLWTKHAAEKARSDAETIAGEIRKHVGVDFDDAKHVLVMPLIEATCDYCGAAWTEDSTDYNGGCCARDQETHETREAALSSTAPSSQTPVSPPPGGESGGRPVVLTYLAGGLRGEERVVRLKYHGNLVSWLDAEIAKRDRQIATFEARNTALRSDLVAALERAEKADLWVNLEIAARELMQKQAQRAEGELLWYKRRFGQAEQVSSLRESDLVIAERGRAEKAEADAAVLRDALEAYKQESCSSVVDCLPGCDYDRPVGEKFDLACKRRADALATDAGESLLRELEALREFARAWSSHETTEEDVRAAYATIEEARKP